MNSEKIILIGAGGHCKACIDVIEQTNKFEIAGILDKENNVMSILGYPVIGNDALIPELVAEEYCFLITVGQIKSSGTRKKLFEKLQSLGAVIATVISPTAYVARSAQIGKGSIIMHNSIVNSEVKIGENCILNTGSIVEHETIIGHHCHISTRVVINGNCIIGNEVFIGSGTVVSNDKEIGSNVIIGASSLVHSDVVEAGIYFDERFLKRRIN